MRECTEGNHIIGCGYDGAQTLCGYVESRRKHPGQFFHYCPSCGKPIPFLDDLADVYEKKYWDGDFDEEE